MKPDNPIKEILERYPTVLEAVEKEGAEILFALARFAGYSVSRSPSTGFPVPMIAYGNGYFAALNFLEDYSFIRELTTAIAEKISAEWVNAGMYSATQYPRLSIGESLVDVSDIATLNAEWQISAERVFAILNATAKERLAALALAVAAKIQSEK